ncbi:MAG: DUF58 domain-containing protein [Phycisphaerae bacterium]|nr:DUF58 domain-containing protein [Phycisphaerae bacterium]
MNQADSGRPTRVDELIDSKMMARLDQIDVVSRKIFSGKIQGERRSRRKGVSVEFADYRPYVHGDDLRFIDWNIYGRLDRLFLKLFMEEEDLSLVIGIDSSGSMGWGKPDKFLYAQKLAMALGYIGLSNQNRVSLFSYNDEGIQLLSNLRGRRRTSELGNWLLQQAPRGGEGFESAMKTISGARSGRGVMIILSDFLYKGGYEKGLRAVAGRGFDVFAMQVLSPEEIDPAGTSSFTGDLRLTDIEDEDTAEVTISPLLLERYRRNLNGWCGNLRDFCVRRDITHMLVDTSTALDTLLLDYLRRRGLLK